MNPASPVGLPVVRFADAANLEVHTAQSPLVHYSASVSYETGSGDATNVPDTAAPNFFTAGPSRNTSRAASEVHRSRLIVTAGFSAERKTVYSTQPGCSRAAA